MKKTDIQDFGKLTSAKYNFSDKVKFWGSELQMYKELIIEQVKLHNEFGETKNSIIYLDEHGTFHIAPSWPDIEYQREYSFYQVKHENSTELYGLKFNFETKERTRTFFIDSVLEISELFLYWSYWYDEN